MTTHPRGMISLSSISHYVFVLGHILFHAHRVSRSSDMVRLEIPFFVFLGKLTSPIFVPEPCANLSYIGATCDVPNNPCEMLNPCSADGRCILDAMAPVGYGCSCFSEFNYGSHCELDHRPCPSGTCENHTLRKPSVAGSSEKDVEVAAKKRRIHRILSKSIGSSAILIIVGFIMWVIIMDILKYGFDVEPVRE